MKVVSVCGIYMAAMTLANLSVATFGPVVSPINSFLFIINKAFALVWGEVLFS